MISLNSAAYEEGFFGEKGRPGARKLVAPILTDREHSLDQLAFPDIILKSQFFGLISRRTLTGEQVLMLAVLVDAINIVRGGCRANGAHEDCPFADAKDWMFESDGRCAVAFEHVCDALGIDGPRLRARISSMISGATDAPVFARRLRLKEASRIGRLTLKGMRRRERRGARLSINSGAAIELESPPEPVPAGFPT